MRGQYYRWNKKPTTGELLSLRAQEVVKGCGGLGRWAWRTYTWTWTSGKTASLALELCPGEGARLHYNVNGEAINPYIVPIVTTRPNYGGVRYWWLCPRCGRRCGVIYGGKLFWCRLCHNLTYETAQSGDRSITVDNRIFAVRRKVGGSNLDNVNDPFPDKPVGMNSRQYWRLLLKWRNLVELRNLLFCRKIYGIISDWPAGWPDAPAEMAPADLAAIDRHIDDLFQNPDQVPASMVADAQRRLAELSERPAVPSPAELRLTLGELAEAARVPFPFAKEAEAAGLIRPDGGRGTRRKRYRPRLASWAGKLYRLRSVGMEWADIRAWTGRRFKPGHEHERKWPAGFDPERQEGRGE